MFWRRVSKGLAGKSRRSANLNGLVLIECPAGRRVPVGRLQPGGARGDEMRAGISTFLTGMFLAINAAHAEGELRIFSWPDYISPKVIERFAQAHDIAVTIDDHETHQQLIDTVRGGGTGYDIVVPSDWVVQLLIEEGLLAETRPSQMANFKNVDPRWVDVFWDPGRNYSAPFLWGTGGIIVDTAVYTGEADTLRLIFDPPPELDGRIDVVPESSDMINAALRYLGKPRCNNDADDLAAVANLLMKAKAHWRSIAYGNEGIASRDTAVSYYWSPGALWARQQKPTLAFVLPREGSSRWMDNIVVLRDATNIENAKLFQNFVMDAEIAALSSEYALAGNVILGSEALISKELAEAPEMNLPPGREPEIVPLCPRDVREKYDAIWAKVTSTGTP
jgi:spermidine/putrescine transport system substrate-binding protein